MKYPFGMRGRVVEVFRYTVAYTETVEEEPVEQIGYCHTQEQAQALAERTGGSITALDSSSYEWMDGIQVADIPDTYGEAVKLYEMGREAYEAALQAPTPEEDSTEMLVDHEYRLTLLELGITEGKEG